MSAGFQAVQWNRRKIVYDAILVAGLLAVVVVKVILRLVREFRDSALALVLERRFPRQLGDRLITAVEMADPHLAKKYGYSQQMRHFIDHFAEGKAPSETFEDGVIVNRIIDACYRSMKTGLWEKVA